MTPADFRVTVLFQRLMPDVCSWVARARCSRSSQSSEGRDLSSSSARSASSERWASSWLSTKSFSIPVSAFGKQFQDRYDYAQCFSTSYSSSYLAAEILLVVLVPQKASPFRAQSAQTIGIVYLGSDIYIAQVRRSCILTGQNSRRKIRGARRYSYPVYVYHHFFINNVQTENAVQIL